MERVIDARRCDDQIMVAVFGEYARKKCDITVVEDGIQNVRHCFMDEEKTLSYLKKYENYLQTSKENIKKSNNKKYGKVMKKRNKIALPVYIISLLLIVLDLLLSGGKITLLAFSAAFLGAASFMIANIEMFIFDKEDALKIKELDSKLKECDELQKIANLARENFKNDELERLRIKSEAARRRRMIEFQPQLNEITKQANLISKQINQINLRAFRTLEEFEKEFQYEGRRR